MEWGGKGRIDAGRAEEPPQSAQRSQSFKVKVKINRGVRRERRVFKVKAKNNHGVHREHRVLGKSKD
jgi:hypothetical protein